MGFLAPAMPFISAGIGALGGLFGGKKKSGSDIASTPYGLQDPEMKQFQGYMGNMGTLAGQQQQTAGQWTQPALDSFLKAQAMNAKWAQSVRDPAAELAAKRAMQSQIQYMDPMTQRGGARAREVGEIQRQGYGQMLAAGQQRQQQAVGNLGQLAGVGGQLGQGFSGLAGQGLQTQIEAMLRLAGQGSEAQRLALMEQQQGIGAGSSLGNLIFGVGSQLPWGDIFKKKGGGGSSGGGVWV